MHYKISEIEDQILATIAADTTNFGAGTLKKLDTFAGQINPQMFFNPEYMQGALALLPFVLVSYQGRTTIRADWDASGKTRIHKPRFRIYTGAQSRRATKDAARGAYDYISALYDDLNAKVPVTSPQQLPGYTPMSGNALTAGAVIQGPLYSIEGADESIVVNLPSIIVYSSDYELKILA
jgi:hypothetical protein